MHMICWKNEKITKLRFPFCIGSDISKAQQNRQQFVQQYSENDMVMKELELLEDEASVFKLIGPVLIKQDPVEAKANVSKRLDYIRAESCVDETIRL